MKINILDIDEKIKMNSKQLEFYQNNYQRTQSKVSILVLFYSLIFIYFFQIIKFPFISTENNFIITLYILILLSHLFFLIRSLVFAYRLLRPVNIAYLHLPRHFYNRIRKKYEKEHKVTGKKLLSEYVKETYLSELEIAVKFNSKVFIKKGHYYYHAFKNAVFSVILYLLCSGFVIFKSNEDATKIIITNYKEIIDNIDTNRLQIKQKIKMAKKDNKETKKVKVVKKTIIKSNPRLIKENFSITEEEVGTETKKMNEKKE